jgi:hypothetical protein
MGGEKEGSKPTHLTNLKNIWVAYQHQFQLERDIRTVDGVTHDTAEHCVLSMQVVRTICDERWVKPV